MSDSTSPLWPAGNPGDASARDLPKLGAPAERALAGAGYTHLAQLTQVRADDLRKLHGMGPKAISILRNALAARGLTFAGEAPAQHQ